MVQKSGLPVEVGSLLCPIISKALYIPGGFPRRISEPSTAFEETFVTAQASSSPEHRGQALLEDTTLRILGGFNQFFLVDTLPETNSSHLKIDLCKRRFLLETTIFRCYVS